MNKVTEAEFDRGLDQTFQHFDKPHKGFLNKQDVTRIIAAAYRNQGGAEKVAIRQELVEQVYSIFDRDHSGSVTYDEFARILKERYFRR